VALEEDFTLINSHRAILLNEVDSVYSLLFSLSANQNVIFKKVPVAVTLLDRRALY
jgi:hypothetical protein